MCCRVESFSHHERHLLNALDKRLQDLLQEFNKISDKIKSSENDTRTREFYLRMLRCKIEAHKSEPELSIIKDVITEVESLCEDISGLDINTYKATVNFYKAFSLKLNGDSRSTTTELYEETIESLSTNQAPYFCLLRVPNSVRSSLANHVRRPQLSLDDTLSKLKKVKSVHFLV